MKNISNRDLLCNLEVYSKISQSYRREIAKNFLMALTNFWGALKWHSRHLQMKTILMVRPGLWKKYRDLVSQQ